MVSGIFKLAIAAITTILLLGLFFTYFMPFFLSEHNLIEAVKKQLSNAESAEGKYLSAEILFPPTFKLNALNLDTEIRSVAFSCNHSSFCCIKGNKCQQAIEWDERKIEMTKATKPKVSTRCKYENIFVCKVFFGEEPAQLAIEKIEFEETFDLGKKSEFDINIFVRNTGKKPLTNAKISADAYQKEEFKKETLIGKDENVIEQLAVNEVKKFELSIQNIKKNGEYVVKIVVEEIEDITDFERKEFSFNVIGAEAPLSGCKTTTTDTIYNVEIDACDTEYYCEGCLFAFMCADAWSEKLGREVDAITKSYAIELVSFEEGKCVVEKPFQAKSLNLNDSFTSQDLTALQNNISQYASTESSEKISKIAWEIYNTFGQGSSNPLPYVWGGKTFDPVKAANRKDPCGNSMPPGVDCSGFVAQVLNLAGFSTKILSANTYSKTLGVVVLDREGLFDASLPKYWQDADLQAGDIIFFHLSSRVGSSSSAIDHVGIYVGNGQFMHSGCPCHKFDDCQLPQPGGGIKLNNLADKGGYYENGLVIARRVQ